jgi:hypothetical protein
MGSGIEPVQISLFVVDPGGVVPIGFRCEADGTEIMRQPDESEESLHKRCGEAVFWPPDTSRHIFKPIYEPGQIFPTMS